MLEQVLAEIHNWFQTGIYPGTYTVEDGGIALPFLQDDQYFRITGSVFNDSLHRYGQDMELHDETFTGSIWALAIPKAVIDLSEEIAAWQKQYGKKAASPFSSESFAGYSYTKVGGANENGGTGGWQAAFKARLNPYRKLREV